MKPAGRPIKCAHCAHSWAYVRDDALYVYQRHNGETHENRITIPELEALFVERYVWYTIGLDIYHNCRPFAERRPATSISRGKWQCVHCGAIWDVFPQ